MSDYNQHNEGQRTTACLMAMSGMKVRDIAEAMDVDERQVVAWLTRTDGNDEPPESA